MIFVLLFLFSNLKFFNVSGRRDYSALTQQENRLHFKESNLLHVTVLRLASSVKIGFFFVPDSNLVGEASEENGRSFQFSPTPLPRRKRVLHNFKVRKGSKDFTTSTPRKTWNPDSVPVTLNPNKARKSGSSRSIKVTSIPRVVRSKETRKNVYLRHCIFPDC